MSPCSGNCAQCSGCARELVITPPELEFLNTLAQYAFLPIARNLGDETPLCLEEGDSTLLLVLEKKGLISLDYSMKLAGYTGYGSYPIQGSTALTQRGQKVLELIDYQGIQEES